MALIFMHNDFFLNRNFNLCYHFQINKILKSTLSIKLDFKFQLEVHENDLLWD